MGKRRKIIQTVFAIQKPNAVQDPLIPLKTANATLAYCVVRAILGKLIKIIANVTTQRSAALFMTRLGKIIQNVLAIRV